MIRILMWGLLIYIAYRIVASMLSAKKQPDARNGTTGNSSAAATYRDPICGLYVSEDDAVIGRLAGERHYFCSHECLEKFREKLEHTS